MHQYVLLKYYNIWKNVAISIEFFNDACKNVLNLFLWNGRLDYCDAMLNVIAMLNVTIFVQYIDIFKSFLWC